jgi:hypothetical protein
MHRYLLSALLSLSVPRSAFTTAGWSQRLGPLGIIAIGLSMLLGVAHTQADVVVISSIKDIVNGTTIDFEQPGNNANDTDFSDPSFWPVFMRLSRPLPMKVLSTQGLQNLQSASSASD